MGVHAVGDVMCDTMLAAVARALQHSTIFARLGLAPKFYAAATLHRAENTDNAARFAQIVDWLERQAVTREIVMPIADILSRTSVDLAP